VKNQQYEYHRRLLAMKPCSGKKVQLENVHWSSVPVQIGDPIVAPDGEYV